MASEPEAASDSKRYMQLMKESKASIFLKGYE